MSVIPLQRFGGGGVFEIMDLFFNGRQYAWMSNEIMIQTRRSTFSGANNQESRTAPTGCYCYIHIIIIIIVNIIRSSSFVVFKIIEGGVAIVLGGH